MWPHTLVMKIENRNVWFHRHYLVKKCAWWNVSFSKVTQTKRRENPKKIFVCKPLNQPIIVIIKSGENKSFVFFLIWNGVNRYNNTVTHKNPTIACLKYSYGQRFSTRIIFCMCVVFYINQIEFVIRLPWFC